MRIETPLETAARIRIEFGVSLNEAARKSLPHFVFDEMSGEDWLSHRDLD
ncbi:MAG: hypothetical protein ACTHJV_13115 [Rhizobiaceae bacterium]